MGKKPDPKKRYIREPERLKCVKLCMEHILTRLINISEACRSGGLKITQQANFMEDVKQALSNVECLAKDGQYGKQIETAMIKVVAGLMAAIGQPVGDESQLNFATVKQVLHLLKNN